MVVSNPSGYISALALLGNPSDGIASKGAISVLSVGSGADSSNNDFPATVQLGTLSGFVFSELTAGSPSFNSKSPADGEAAVASPSR